MIDADTALALTQERVQTFFAGGVESLLVSGADEIAWEEWTASIRQSSEETWLRCNAFLLAHTLGRFLARSAPARSGATRDPWLEAFVAAVASEDTRAERVLWCSAPVANPLADDGVRSSMVLWSLCEALRTSRPLDGARPGPYPHPVWFEDDDGRGDPDAIPAE